MAAREDEERGRGIPYTELERLQRHMEFYPGELLPERGYGLSAGQMSVDAIVGSSLQDLALALNAVEDSLPSGGQAKLELCTESSPTDEDLAVFYLSLVANGFHTSYPETSIVGGIPTTSIILEKGSPQWAMLIPLLIPALTIGLIAFGITKVETLSKAILPLLLVAVGGIIIFAGLMRRPAERVAERVGAKYLPSTLPKALAAR